MRDRSIGRRIFSDKNTDLPKEIEEKLRKSYGLEGMPKEVLQYIIGYQFRVTSKKVKELNETTVYLNYFGKFEFREHLHNRRRVIIDRLFLKEGFNEKNAITEYESKYKKQLEYRVGFYAIRNKYKEEVKKDLEENKRLAFEKEGKLELYNQLKTQGLI